MGDKVPLLDSETEEQDLRIVLIGKTGAGKSATANTILGKKVFKSEMCSSTVTATCQKETGLFSGQTLSVVDTPGLFDPLKSYEDVQREIIRCISFVSPGPHAFLVVIQPNRFTEEEKETTDLIKQIFGEKAADYTMALFTRGDDLKADEVSIENFIDKNPALRSFIDQCVGGYHVFNNRDKDPSQVKELLDKINMMVDINGESYYTNEMLKAVESAIREETISIMGENPSITSKEARRKAEGNNNFLRCFLPAGIAGAGGLVGAGVGAGVGVGTGIGVEVAIGAGIGLVGGPVGAVVGAAVGAAAGLVVAGIVVASERKACVIQ